MAQIHTSIFGDRGMRALLALLGCVGAIYSAQAAEPLSARAAIARGNHDWIIGMQTGDATLIANSYTEDALDCGPTGECERGRAAILVSIQNRLANSGHASVAEVSSAGSSRQGNFVYEWGASRAQFSDGRKREGRYLTVWRREGDSWKIFRNLSIPNEPGR
jgi:ketosteroid isomerase-like protein